MKITEFKVDDKITRTEPLKNLKGMKKKEYEAEKFIGKRVIFQGIDEKSKMIFLIDDWGHLEEISFVKDAWIDGWEKWPEDLFQKAEKEVKKIEEERKAKEKEE